MSLEVEISLVELEREIERIGQMQPQIVTRGKQRVRLVGLSILRGVRERTPIDTGRARNSWGRDIWEIIDDGWGVLQGSNVVYFQRLNEGWSQQAPAGFVDVEAERGLDELADGLGEDVEGIL